MKMLSNGSNNRVFNIYSEAPSRRQVPISSSTASDTTSSSTTTSLVPVADANRLEEQALVAVLMNSTATNLLMLLKDKV